MDSTPSAAPARPPRSRWRSRLRGEGPPTAGEHDGVAVIDLPPAREHAPADLAGMLLSAFGIVIVLVLGVYAHATTVGVTEDVQSITRVLNSVLSVAVSVLGGLVSLVLPIGVLVRLVLRRRIRRAVESVAALAIGVGIALLFAWALQTGAGQVWRSLTITVHDATVAATSPFATGLAAMLVLAGPRGADGWVRWSWNLLWLSLAVAVVTGSLTLPGAIVSLWLGTFVGWGLRYLLGSRPERAYGADLVHAVRQTGLSPARLVRVLPADRLAELTAGRAPDAAAVAAITDASDAGALAVAAHADARVYAVLDEQGKRFDAVMVDADRRVVGVAGRLWQALRVRGLAARAVVSVHQATEHTALISLIGREAGVGVPRVIGLGEQAGSMVIAQSHIEDATLLRDVPDDQLDDALLTGIWREVLAAQRASLAHGAISADAVLIGPPTEAGPRDVWLIGWDDGGAAAQDLALRIDVAQTLAMIALLVGAPRAVAGAASQLGHDELARIAPVLQPVMLPRETRADAKAKRQIMADLRAELVEELPAVDTTPVSLRRFSWRTVVMATVIVIAAWVLLATMNFDDIVAAVRSANPWWIIAVFVAGLLPYLGASLELVAFCPEKLPVWRTTLVQLAASVVALVAPAAVGPAALNLTYLRRRKVSTPLAVASVALAQVMLFVTTVVLLVVVSLATGDFSALTSFPKTAALVVVAVVALVGGALAIPAVRGWIWGKIGPTLHQVWPRLVWVLGQPRRLAVGLTGTTLHAAGYVVAFWAAAQAFGVTNVPFTTIAIIYLLGNTAGSALPTPGGAGTVELALTGGLVSAGVAQAVAASVAVLFRAVTFWLMAPIGYVALRYVRRTGDV